MDSKIKQDYMDIDEFLSARGLCDAFPESDYTDDDFNSIPDNAEFDGNLGQLLTEQLPASISEFAGSDEGRDSAGNSPSESSDEGRGESIASESIVSGQSSGSEYTEGRRKRRKNMNGQKNPKKTRTQRSKTAKANKKHSSNNNNQLATAVDIDGVEYSYSIEAEVKHKRQKQSVPGDMKDQKYWERRLKNNVAAKRSRDLKRQKEMSVASKAANLEVENEKLRNEVTMLKKRLENLSEKLDDNEKQ